METQKVVGQVTMRNQSRLRIKITPPPLKEKLNEVRLAIEEEVQERLEEDRTPMHWEGEVFGLRWTADLETIHDEILVNLGPDLLEQLRALTAG